MKRRILVIDDESVLTDMVKHMLEAAGPYVVRTVNDSRKAARWAQVFRPHMILLDLHMPHKDGADVIAEIRRQARGLSVPVVFVTALVSRKEAESRRFFGDFRCLAKPVSSEELIECVERTLLLAPKSRRLPVSRSSSSQHLFSTNLDRQGGRGAKHQPPQRLERLNAGHF